MYKKNPFQKGVPTGSVNFTNSTQIVGPAGLLLTTSCTICMWTLMTTSVGDWALVINSTGSAYNGFGTGSGGTDLNVFSSNFNGNTLSAYVLGVWKFLCYTGNGTSCVAYAIDKGNILTTVVQSGLTGTANETLRISDDGFGSGAFPGIISAVNLYNYPLSKAEIITQSKQLFPFTERGLVGSLPMKNIGNVNIDSLITGHTWTKTGTYARSTFSPPVPEVVKKQFSWYY